ncbi:KAP family NTPase [Geobacter pelophilus]|uniref:KAP family NTPase n=1 Tax=Geoanaerobacter pelophilus TaxID=60036 RepID=A0AAW4L5R4_9BACT|nr:P-loop NTPase fold protein [Geoanaerobacter pelophilus]MBT0666238.1 KAP family NTPase [Geoanaerobacter pelophilus]
MSNDRLLYMRQPDYVEDGVPFKNDLFERSLLAEKLTNYIYRLKDGCVIGIDAPWGEGKTYFGRNWASQLTQQGFKTIYLDAFEQDYAEDPFLLISAEILSALADAEQDESWSNFRDACVKVGKALLPATAKITINALGRLILGINDLSEIKEEFGDKLEEKLGDASEKFVRQRLQDYERDRKTAEHFRMALSDFAADQEKPVVFIIDELDRCKPSFAVNVIERIKHFFDTPNIVFVLLLNRTQLENAINGVYGAELDAHAYLGKFIHFFLRLPKRVSLDGQRDFNQAYCDYLSNHYKFQQTDAVRGFSDALAFFATIWGLSFRDLEKAYIHFTMGQPIGASAPIAAYLVALKLSQPELFHELSIGNKDGHSKALQLIGGLISTIKDHWLLPSLQALHHGAINGFDNIKPEVLSHVRYLIQGVGYRPETIMCSIAKKLDISFVD